MEINQFLCLYYFYTLFFMAFVAINSFYAFCTTFFGWYLFTGKVMETDERMEET